MHTGRDMTWLSLYPTAVYLKFLHVLPENNKTSQICDIIFILSNNNNKHCCIWILNLFYSFLVRISSIRDAVGSQLTICRFCFFFKAENLGKKSGKKCISSLFCLTSIPKRLILLKGIYFILLPPRKPHCSG